MRHDSRRLRLLVVLLLMTSLTLVTLDVRGGRTGPLGAVRTAVHAVLGPIETAAASVWHPVAHFLSSLAHVGRDRRTAERLAKENADLRARLDALNASATTQTELHRLLDVAGRGAYRVVAARVVAFGEAVGYEWTAVIDVGSKDRITKNMTVINGDGLVGRTISVGPYTSTVLLDIDPFSTVGARLEGSGQLGKIDGDGQNPLRFTLFSASQPIAVGQRIVSFGSADSRPYVAGVPIGEVTTVLTAPGGLTRTALVRPYVNLTALDVVGVVIAPPRTDPRDSVLPPLPVAAAPPKPSPAASPSSSPLPSSSPSPVRTPAPAPAPSSAPSSAPPAGAPSRPTASPTR